MNQYMYFNLQQIVDNDSYPFTMGQLRGFVLHRQKNGLHKAIRKIGKRVYFRKDLFENWMESFIEEENVFED